MLVESAIDGIVGPGGADPVTHIPTFHRGPVLTPGPDTTKVDSLHHDVLALQKEIYARPEFRELMRKLAERRPAIAAGWRAPLPGEDPLLMSDLTSREGWLEAAAYWHEVEALARVLGPYTLWTGADLDWRLRRWRNEESLGFQARKRGIRSPVVIAYVLTANAPKTKPHPKAADTARMVAHSVALIAIGVRPGVADARAAGPYRTEGAVRLARKRWRERLTATS